MYLSTEDKLKEKILFCTECGSTDLRVVLDPEPHLYCHDCYQELFEDVDYSSVIENKLKQLHRAKQALKQIAEQTTRTQDTLCNLKLETCTNDCKSCFQRIAREVLEEINEQKAS